MNQQIQVVQLTGGGEKAAATELILLRLPEWFGNPQAVRGYIGQVRTLPYWAAIDRKRNYVGFLAAALQHGHTGEIVVCGVLPEYHRTGIGRALYSAAERYFLENGCQYALVKTLDGSADYEPYVRTRQFYRAIGFEPLATLPEVWDAENPCLLMLKSLAGQKEAQHGDAFAGAKQLLSAAFLAREQAYVPYSHFAVGAALQTEEGRVYSGCNIENAAYGPSNCAERTAVFKAVSEGERHFSAIAIVGAPQGMDKEDFSACWPCGVCRQVLREFCTPDFRVITFSGKEGVCAAALGELLPHDFGPEMLQGGRRPG